MKIILIGPNLEENLSLRYLSSCLKLSNHEVELIPFNSVHETEKVLNSSRYADIVGISLAFQARAREFLTLAKEIKEKNPSTLIVAGGHYASCAASELLKNHPELDIIVIHEGEQTIVEIANAGKNIYEHISKIKGVAYRNEKEVIFTQPRPIEEDLDKIPLPDRNGKIYLHVGVPSAYVLGSRGCLNSCAYCCISTLHKLSPGKKFRQRSVEKIASEMAELYHGRGIRQFIFHDDNFLVPSETKNLTRIEALDQELKKTGVKDIGIVIKCRPSDVSSKVFEKLHSMGLIRVFLGIESSCDNVLEKLNRNQSMSDVDKALNICSQLGISVQFNIMMFHPFATPQTIESDILFLKQHNSYPFNICRTEIYSGTPLEQMMIDKGYARGNYLARAYNITDPVADLACRAAVKLFHKRCWSKDSLMELAIGIDHLCAVLGHFYQGDKIQNILNSIRSWQLNVNNDIINLAESVLKASKNCSTTDENELTQLISSMKEIENNSLIKLIEEGRKLFEEMNELSLGLVGLKRIKKGKYRLEKPISNLAKHAAAVFLSITITGCSTCNNNVGVCEYAPIPLEDTDGDNLPDECERQIFFTAPKHFDTDGDGISDGKEDHDLDGFTNVQEQERVGSWHCSDFYPSTPDIDGDGLRNRCEREIFGTDPTMPDTDGDGILDGLEDHDGDGVPNKDIQLSNPDGPCLEVDIQHDIGVCEFAPAPLDNDDNDN